MGTILTGHTFWRLRGGPLLEHPSPFLKPLAHFEKLGHEAHHAERVFSPRHRAQRPVEVFGHIALVLRSLAVTVGEAAVLAGDDVKQPVLVPGARIVLHLAGQSEIVLRIPEHVFDVV